MLRLILLNPHPTARTATHCGMNVTTDRAIEGVSADRYLQHSMGHTWNRIGELTSNRRRSKSYGDDLFGRNGRGTSGKRCATSVKPIQDPTSYKNSQPYTQ